MGDPLIAGHPDDILTAAYLDGTLDAPSRDRFEAHLAQCDRCRDGVTLLRSAEDPPPAVPGELLSRARSASARRGRILRGGWLLGMAASLVLALGIRAVILRSGSGTVVEETPVRGDASGFSGLSPSAGSPIPAAQLLFRWSAVEGADRYEISLFDASGRKVGHVTADGKASSAPWPIDAPPPAPGAYIWKIRAMALDRIVAESEPISFELAP